MKGRLVLVQYSANLDGSAFSALMLADGLQAAGWDTHVTFAFDGPIIERFREAGHRVRVVPHKNWIRTPHPLRFMRNVYRQRRASRGFSAVFDEVVPDLVYINTAVSMAGALAAYRRGTPCIWHLRELFADVGGEMKAPRLFVPYVRGTFRKLAGRLVVNSAAVAENMLGPYADDAEVVPNAVDAVFFDDKRSPAEARRVFGLPEEGRIVGVPGTLRPMKGHPFFFEALARHVRRRPDVIAAVPGGGNADYVRRMEALVETYGLARNVRFLGYVDDMSALYRACDVACIPSVAEPFGRTVIEAFAAGTPVVATAVGGIRETVEDGRTGLLVPYGDVDGLANGLDRLLDDDALRTRLRCNARKEAEEKYRASVYTERLLTLIQESAGRSGR